MSNNKIDMDISNLADGGLQEKLDLELKKVFENIHDPNTQATDKRKVQITIELMPTANRDVVDISSKIKTTLAPLTDVVTTVITGLDMRGRVEARELKSGIKGQMFIDENGEVRDDVGTSVEEIENNVINLQKKEG